jgi:hypothetical protein
MSYGCQVVPIATELQDGAAERPVALCCTQPWHWTEVADGCCVCLSLVLGLGNAGPRVLKQWWWQGCESDSGYLRLAKRARAGYLRRAVL